MKKLLTTICVILACALSASAQIQTNAGVQYLQCMQKDMSADFNDLSTNNPEKCTLHLRKVPANVRDARLDLSEVDYLIEQ